MDRGSEHRIRPPVWHGGFAAKRMAGISQTHLVHGYPAPPTTEDAHVVSVVAAALLGEGMSSPLMDEVRERRGLVYYAGCSTDQNDLAGQFVVDASMAPENVEAFVDTLLQLMRRQADWIEPVDLERARNQIAVRRLHLLERPDRLLEEAALDLFALGHIRSQAERLERMLAVDARTLQAAFAQMLEQPPAIAVAGKVRMAAQAHLKSLATEPVSRSLQ